MGIEFQSTCPLFFSFSSTFLMVQPVWLLYLSNGRHDNTKLSSVILYEWFNLAFSLPSQFILETFVDVVPKVFLSVNGGRDGSPFVTVGAQLLSCRPALPFRGEAAIVLRLLRIRTKVDPRRF